MANQKPDVYLLQKRCEELKALLQKFLHADLPTSNWKTLISISKEARETLQNPVDINVTLSSDGAALFDLEANTKGTLDRPVLEKIWGLLNKVIVRCSYNKETGEIELRHVFLKGNVYELKKMEDGDFAGVFKAEDLGL